MTELSGLSSGTLPTLGRLISLDDSSLATVPLDRSEELPLDAPDETVPELLEETVFRLETGTFELAAEDTDETEEDCCFRICSTCSAVYPLTVLTVPDEPDDAEDVDAADARAGLNKKARTKVSKNSHALFCFFIAIPPHRLP